MRSLLTVSMDYFFMGLDDGKTMPILAVRDHATRRTAAYPVIAKGVDEHAVEKLKGFIIKTGYKRLHLKDYQEPTIFGAKGTGAEDA